MSELGLVPLPDNDAARRQLIHHFIDLVTQATATKERLGNRFPGTMPMTLSRRHLPMVTQNDYVALEKSDGTRYMLLAVSSYVILIDRRMLVYVVEPNPQVLSKGFVRPQDNTILDGELTYNQITRQWDYLIYDCIAIDGDLSIAQCGFRQRMQAAEAFVAGPRLWAPFCAGLLRLRIKDFYETKNLRRLFQRIRKNPEGAYIYQNNDRRDGVLCNENDGVIFSPVGMPYQIKNCPALLKWKPPHLNSVDFQILLTKSFDSRRNEPSVKSSIAYRGDGNRNITLREVLFPSAIRRKFASDFDKYNNSIVELAYDRGGGEWAYIRQRDDKDTPNFSSTIIDTMETVSESMDREELVRCMETRSTSHPNSEKPFVELNARNEAACVFRNDYFDSENSDYVLSTPISLVGPPVMERPPEMDRGRRGQPRQGQGGRNRRNSHENAETNGDAGDGQSEQDGGRAPFMYDDDV